MTILEQSLSKTIKLYTLVVSVLPLISVPTA